MSPLTSKFLAYRAKPKVPTAPPPERQHAPTDGYLSNSETYQERLTRIVEYYAKGLILGPLDAAFYSRKTWYNSRRGKDMYRKGERNVAGAIAHSLPVLGGFR